MMFYCKHFSHCYIQLNVKWTECEKSEDLPEGGFKHLQFEHGL